MLLDDLASVVDERDLGRAAVDCLGHAAVEGVVPVAVRPTPSPPSGTANHHPRRVKSAGWGDLAIDNNAAERALRRIAIGRKNWLFAGSDTGGRTAAILFSLIATCQRHDVEPVAYLKDVLTRIAAHPANQLAELLPNRWKPSA